MGGRTHGPQPSQQITGKRQSTRYPFACRGEQGADNQRSIRHHASFKVNVQHFWATFGQCNHRCSSHVVAASKGCVRNTGAVLGQHNCSCIRQIAAPTIKSACVILKQCDANTITAASVKKPGHRSPAPLKLAWVSSGHVSDNVVAWASPCIELNVAASVNGNRWHTAAVYFKGTSVVAAPPHPPGLKVEVSTVQTLARCSPRFANVRHCNHPSFGRCFGSRRQLPLRVAVLPAGTSPHCRAPTAMQMCSIKCENVCRRIFGKHKVNKVTVCFKRATIRAHVVGI